MSDTPYTNFDSAREASHAEATARPDRATCPQCGAEARWAAVRSDCGDRAEIEYLREIQCVYCGTVIVNARGDVLRYEVVVMANGLMIFPATAHHRRYSDRAAWEGRC